MKILVISQFYSPDITAPAFRMAETVNYLKDFGNEVEVITTYPYKSENRVKKNQKNIHRVELSNTEGKGFLGYLYFYISFMLKSIFKGFIIGRRQKPDIILATSPPIFVGLSGLIVSKMLKATFALDIRDIWPDSAVAAGQLSKGGKAYSLARWLEKLLYRQADKITCVAKPMKEYIQKHTKTPVKVIYNGVEVLKKEEYENFDLLSKFSSKENTRKLLYAGNMGHVQQLDLLIDSYHELYNKSLIDNWEIFLLGAGIQKDSLVNQTENYGLSSKVHFVDPVPKKEINKYLISADALFIHLKDSPVLRLTIPSKVFDYMAVNKPLLAGIHGEGKKIINSMEGNIIFSSGDKSSLNNAIIKLDKVLNNNGEPKNAEAIKNGYNRLRQSKKWAAFLNKNYKN